MPLLLGSVLLLIATVKAVRERKDPRRLILWGALHDAGVACMALTAQTAAGLTGLWLFVIFQISARLLALAALARLAPCGATLDELRGAGRRNPWAGALFGLGLLAAVGGSPFLLPEARALIVQGLLEAAPAGGLLCLLLMAAATTVFIWLYVDAVRRVSLEEAPESAEGADALERFAWWFVPFVDTDGVAEGYYGKDQAHNDLNRAWHRNFPRRIELRAVQQDMRVWQQTTQARLMLDMHAPGHGERESYFPVGADTPDAFRQELRALCGALNVHLRACGLQEAIFLEKKPGNNTSAQAGMTSAEYAHACKVNGSTFECTYQGERTGRTYEIQDYRRIGACMVKAICDAIL